MKKIYFLIFAISFFMSAQNRIDDLNVLQGKWKLENGNANYYEEWEKINDTTFSGISYEFKDDRKYTLEKLTILKLNNHIVYIAQPGNNNPTLFTLTSSENKKFIFENEEHDFPQRVIYHFSSENQLNASIEGIVNENLERKDFIFIRENND
jgi:hypothetical protein